MLFLLFFNKLILGKQKIKTSFSKKNLYVCQKLRFSMQLFDVYPLYPIQPVRAAYSYLWDKNNVRYLDLYGGHAVISIGHTHPHYVQRLTEQLQKIAFYSNFVLNDLQNELAEKLGKMSNYPNYSLFLCNSGAEANENALKLASFHSRKRKVICFKQSFHGRTEGAVVITDNPSIIAPVNQKNNIIFLDLNDIEVLENYLKKEDVCAVIVEGIQGVGGVQTPKIEFLRAARRLCNRHRTLLILDEVQSGYGRTGKFFAHQYADIQADLITVAKGMGNGFPIGGVLISPEFKAVSGMLGTTFGGNHLACVAGLAVLEVMENENLMQKALAEGEYLVSELQKFEQIKEIRGKGLMIGIELYEDSKKIREKLLYEHQIFTGSSSNKNTMRLLPALNIQRADLDYFLECLAKVLAK